MLPFILVLAVITGAFAAPQVNIQQQVGPGGDGSLLGGANWAVLGGGDITVGVHNAEAILKDLARVPAGQNLALGVGLSVLGELSVGRPGDACAAANYINAYVRNQGAGIGNSLINYIQSVINSIDNIVNAATNTQRARFSVGARSGCPAEGREYLFESAWNSILGAASPAQLSLLSEQYCSAKNLYCSFTAVNNNIGALITASSLPPTQQVFNKAAPAVSQLIQALASGQSPTAAANGAKQALASAAQFVAKQY